jgi:hypothetical protein
VVRGIEAARNNGQVHSLNKTIEAELVEQGNDSRRLRTSHPRVNEYTP